MVTDHHLLVVRAGTLRASVPLFGFYGDGGCSDAGGEGYSGVTSSAVTSPLCRICCGDEDDDARVVVVVLTGVLVVDVRGPHTRMAYRFVHPGCGLPEGACASATYDPDGEWLPGLLSGRCRVPVSGVAVKVVGVEFVALTLIVVVYSDVVELVGVSREEMEEGVPTVYDEGRRCGAVSLWRIRGSYSKPAVCRVGMFLAVSQGCSLVEVFPLCLRLGTWGQRTGCRAGDNYATCWLPSGAPQQNCACLSDEPCDWARLSACPRALEAISHGCRSASTRLCGHKIVSQEWHCVSGRCLLCVTCLDSNAGDPFIVFLAVQPCPVREASQLRPGWGTQLGGGVTGAASSTVEGMTLVLVPVGRVSIGSVSTSAVSIHIVPSYTCPDGGTWGGDMLELLCVEKDGSVIRKAYCYNPHQNNCLLGNPSFDRLLPQLLNPIQGHYGAITAVDVLPVWWSREVVFGCLAPCTERLLEAQRYRLVLSFRDGMMMQVMVDLAEGVVSVEAFLTLGVHTHPPLLAAVVVDGATGPQQIVLGLTQARLFVIKHVWLSDGTAESSVLVIAPNPVGCFPGAYCGCSACGVCDVCPEAGEDINAIREAVARLSIEVNRGDELYMPTELLRTCGSDARNLEKQVGAGYSRALPADMGASATVSGALGRFCCGCEACEGNGRLEPVTPPSPLSALKVCGLRVTAEGVYYCVEMFVSGVGGARKRQWWYAPTTLLTSVPGERSSLAAHDEPPPYRVSVRPLAASPSIGSIREGGHSCIGVVRVTWSEGTRSLLVHCPLLPEGAPLELSPFEDMTEEYNPVRVDSVRLVNGVFIVCVLGMAGAEGDKTVLVVYALDILRDVSARPIFERELVIHDAATFFVCEGGGLVVLQRGSKAIVCWTRTSISDDGAGYCWRECCVCGGAESREAVSTMAPLWSGNNGTCFDGEVCTSFTRLVYISSGEGLIKMCEVAPRRSPPALLRGEDYSQGCVDVSGAEPVCVSTPTAGVELYHPTTMLLLLTMRRPRAVRVALEDILEVAVEATVSGRGVDDGSQRVVEMLCQSSVGVSPVSCPTVISLPGTFGAAAASASRAATVVQRACELEEKGVSCPDDTAAAFGAGIPLELLDEVMKFLVQVQLRGLSGQEQLALLCIVEGLRAVRVSGVAADACASRCVFSQKLAQLRRRRRIVVPSTGDLPAGYANFLWASLSDGQPQLVDVLCATDGCGLSWSNVEAAGVPFWLGSLQHLRGIAERVAREQYQRSRDVRECALMYCLARKPGVISALCRICGNAKLEAFFSRNFYEPKNRAAAVTNAFAAVSKNLLEYGAAFFVLAGEARNAAQVLLQRGGSVSLALFVMRLASDDNPDDLIWFTQQRKREEASCGAVCVWEEACLLLRCRRREEALLLLSRRTPLCAVEGADRLALLRIAGACAAGGGDTTGRETLRLLMHTLRLSCSAGMVLPATLFCGEVALCLPRLSEDVAAGNWRPKECTITATKDATSRMVADFNSGTLALGALDMDDSAREERLTTVAPAAWCAVSPSGTGGTVPDSALGVVGGSDWAVDPSVVFCLSCELDFIRARLRGPVAVPLRQGVGDGEGTGVAFDILLCAARLLAFVGSSNPVSGICSYLRQLLQLLPEEQCGSERSDGPPEVASSEAEGGDGVGLRLVIIAVRVTLMTVAMRNGDCALAGALLSLPTIDDVLLMDGTRVVTLRTVAAYLRALRQAVGDLRSLAAECAGEGEVGMGVSGVGPRGVHGAGSSCFVFTASAEALDGAGDVARTGDRSEEVRKRELRALLLAWCAARLYLSSFEDLRLEVARLSGPYRGSLVSVVLLQLWLACYMLCRVALGFSYASSRFMGSVMSMQSCHAALPVNPNGIFVEVTRQLRRLVAVLTHDLSDLTNYLRGSDAPTACSYERRYPVLLRLCASYSEASWQSPMRSTSLLVLAESVRTLLSGALVSHTVECFLYERLSQGDGGAVRTMEATWLRCHLTRRGRREKLLSCLLEGAAILRCGESTVVQRCSRSVSAVDYDRFSIDGMVWSTASSVVTRDGCCGVLSGFDPTSLVTGVQLRDAVLPSQLRRVGDEEGCGAAERLFDGVTVGAVAPTAMGSPTGAGGVAGVDCKLLSKRPCLPLVDGSVVTAHPRLPLFSAPHGDGCIDFYSFTSPECVKTFDCGDSRAVTGVAYSADGGTFVAGMADGSVRGWRLDAPPTDRAAPPVFVHHVLPGGGVRAVMFCGASQSRVAVVGFSHNTILRSGRDAEWGESVCGFGGRLKPTSAKPSSGGGLFGFSGAGQCERIGTEVLLVVDLILRPGTYSWKVLPLTPDHAVYLGGLGCVMCASSYGAVAVYDVWNSRLYTFSQTPDVSVTCLAASCHDDIVAIGTAEGAVLLLHFRSIREAMLSYRGTSGCVPGHGPTGEVAMFGDSLLLKASRLEVLSPTSPRCGVHSLVFTPSALLAGLGDGEILAVGFPFTAIRPDKATV